ncbi:dTDP-4-dehydrorhamnose reductase [Faecalibacter rhinopitheci]|uniref:dTDP-4-dehydrorhamnose reductase n=1 Tax=Faecalibacter rhinopitheci TaxID=2779678 RepID=A0A8J7K3U1_9FLAO|nr:dTDP-4-dehydrorhamnose reductase [Faecalibacter rhinopitheci]MBF0596858.1 dTDP-4-dehydrorhamnose reductase [Faecalibacter rhinopitheci]
MKKILVTGANGQLGQAIHEISTNYKELEFVFVSRNELDITNQELVKNYFENNVFDAVVNCAAYTAVDLAESDIANARLINATATQYLAEITANKNIPFIHISTDYVFDGTISTPRLEADPTNPIGVYGQTKLEGEYLALSINPQTIIIRTAWVYSKYGKNFVKTMLWLFKEKEEIGVIDDQIGSPTNAVDLADAIAQMLSKDNLVYGIYNYSNEGKCSWFEFASKIKALTNSSIIINPIPTTSYPTPAKRPAYSLLDKSKIKETYQIEIPNWEESLSKELKAMGV